MRWDELFADLEGQLEDGLGGEERELRVEEERLRVGRATMRDRVSSIAALHEPLRMRLAGGAVHALTPRTVGRDWVSGDLAGTAAQAVVPLAAVAALLPTSQQLERSLEPAGGGGVTDRLGLAFVLRDLARRRRVVQLHTRSGTTTGTLDRVGRDHLDVAVHPVDQWRRASDVHHVEVLALAELLLLRVD